MTIALVLSLSDVDAVGDEGSACLGYVEAQSMAINDAVITANTAYTFMFLQLAALAYLDSIFSTRHSPLPSHIIASAAESLPFETPCVRRSLPTDQHVEARSRYYRDISVHVEEFCEQH